MNRFNPFFVHETMTNGLNTPLLHKSMFHMSMILFNEIIAMFDGTVFGSGANIRSGIKPPNFRRYLKNTVVDENLVGLSAFLEYFLFDINKLYIIEGELEM